MTPIAPRTLGTCPICGRPREWYAALPGWWCGETDYWGGRPSPHPTHHGPAPLQLVKMPAAKRAKIMAAAGERSPAATPAKRGQIGVQV
jgi:hypothetical protein